MFRLPGSPAAQESPCRVASSFLLCRRPGVAPVQAAQSSSLPWLRVPPLAKDLRLSHRRVTQGAASGRRPGAFPFAGWLGGPRACGPRSPLAAGGGLPPRRWLRVPAGQGPEVSRRRVAPGFSVPGARRRPLPGGPGLPPRRVAESLLFAGGSGFPPGTKGPRIRPLPVAPGFLRPEAREFPLPGGSGCLSGRDLKSSLCRFGSGVSPVALAWVSPSPATVPGGREISTPVSRAAQEVSADNFKILWPSTSHPQLTLGCPPRQTFLHRILHSLVHRLCGLCPGQHP